MTARVLALVALAILGAFLFILAWKLQRIDLWFLVAMTMALALWDLVRGTR